jgi:hypothetical protein
VGREIRGPPWCKRIQYWAVRRAGRYLDVCRRGDIDDGDGHPSEADFLDWLDSTRDASPLGSYWPFGLPFTGGSAKRQRFDQRGEIRMPAPKLMEFSGVQKLAPETIEKHEIAQALQDVAFAFETQLSDLRARRLPLKSWEDHGVEERFSPHGTI